jgi:aminoglycoside phosphotransferase (APT) family kinase protein
LSCGRDDGLGFPCIVMSRVAGGTLRSGTTWSEKARIPALLAETLAQLHGLDSKRFEQALAEAGWPPRTTGLEATLDALAERAAPLASGGYAAAVAWLRSNRPAPSSPVVCHGDFHPLNLVIREGRVSGLLDWSHALLADPEYDLAYCAQLFAWWPLPARGLLRHLVGRPAAGQFIRGYRRLRPVNEDRYRWHEALHALRLLVRVARARAGITLPPLADTHPWERVSADAAATLASRTGIRIELPSR